MRRGSLILPGLLVAMAIAVFAALTAPAAFADEGIHTKGWGATPADCASCHRAHRAAAPELLVTDAEGLCITCHGNDASGSDLNVMAGTNEDDGGALRGGGFENARIDTDDPSLRPDPVTILPLPAPGEAVQSKHSTNGDPQTIWGYGAVNSVGDPGGPDYPLSCGKCHDPHGNGNYRILRTVPSGLLSYGQPLPEFMPDLSGRLADEATKVYTIADYWNVDYTDQWEDSDGDHVADLETTGREVGRWCTTCHTRYLAQTGSSETASGDAIFAYGHTTDPEGRGSHGPGPVTLSGSCVKCHVAHGSNAVVSGDASTEELPDSTVNPAGDTSDSRLLKMNNRGVCQKCHNK